jgi:hypothetical protein
LGYLENPQKFVLQKTAGLRFTNLERVITNIYTDLQRATVRIVACFERFSTEQVASANARTSPTCGNGIQTFRGKGWGFEF